MEPLGEGLGGCHHDSALRKVPGVSLLRGGGKLTVRTRKPVWWMRPGYAGPEGGNDAVIPRNPDELPSGCESRPTKAEPGRSVVSLAAVTVTGRLMRRQASTWAVGRQPRNGYSPGKPRGSPTLKAAGGVTVNGRGGTSPGGVDDHGTLAQGNPVTGEAPAGPRVSAGRRGTRSQASDAPGVHGRTPGRLRISVRTRGRSGQGKPEPRPTPQGSRRTAYERRRRGTGWHPGPGRAKAVRVVTNFRRET
jgi:hypothetical protein